MTFDEIRELIDATISENGERQITGKALNLALHELVSAIENNKPEGAGAETIYFYDDSENMTLTEEHQTSNAAVYAKCQAFASEGKPLPSINIDMSKSIAESLGPILGVPINLYMVQPALTVIYVPSDDPAAAVMGATGLILDVTTGNTTIVVLADGTINLLT